MPHWRTVSAGALTRRRKFFDENHFQYGRDATRKVLAETQQV
jgi:hypothetical protein